jgi:hypothetical protein
MATPEGQIQNAICDYLSLKGHFFWRNNSIGVYDPVGKRFRSTPKYAMNGVPDIILIKDGFFVGLEVKTPKGRQSDNQKDFEKKCKEAGAEYYLVRSIDDVQEIGL